jgi:hypothetical protein
MAPDWAFPVVFEMVEPVGRLDKRRAAPCERVSNTNAVGRGTEMDFLLRCCRRLRRCGGSILCRLIYCADEANTLARDGPNQPLLIATVADRFAGGVDTAVKSRVRHNPAAPNRSDKIVLANHAITVLDEIQQQVEHLRLKRDELSAPPKLAAIRIEYLVFKAKLHVRPRGRFHGMLKFIGKTIQVGVADCWARAASDAAEMSPNK